MTNHQHSRSGPARTVRAGPVRQARRAVYAAGTITLLVGALSCDPGRGPLHGGEAVPVFDRYDPPSSLSRLTWVAVDGVDGAAADFLVRGDTMFLLDAATREILVLVREEALEVLQPSRWTRVSSFGRMGSGPGEFRRPTGLAWGPQGSVAVWDESGRISYFAADGTLLDEMRVQLPCALFRSSIAAAAGELFLGGSCAGGAGRGDTVFAVAYRVERDSSVTEVAATPAFTFDMRFGSILTAPRLVTESRDAVMFASGLDSCPVRLTEPSDRLETSMPCAAPPASYRSPEPPASQSMRLPNGARLRWPDPIPPLFAHLAGSEPYIVQLYSPDSVVVTPWRPGARPVAVAPALEFVSCRDSHCLWLDPMKRVLALHSDSSFRQAAVGLTAP